MFLCALKLSGTYGVPQLFCLSGSVGHTLSHFFCYAKKKKKMFLFFEKVLHHENIIKVVIMMPDKFSLKGLNENSVN
jgi:hypothetical protein